MSPLTQKLTKAGMLIGTGLLMLGFSAANAESYPDRPIGVMVAYNPGGATDFQARIATLASAKVDKEEKPISVGQPIYVTNKPGAGGRTHISARITVGQQHPSLGNRINMWRVYLGITVCTDITVAHIVSQNNDDIR